MKKKLLLFSAILLIVMPVAVSAEMVSSIAVLVNGDPITTYDLAKEQEALARNIKESGDPVPGTDQLRQVALESLINKKLIEQKIQELGIKISDDEINKAIEDVKKTNNISEEKLLAALAARGISFDDYKAQLKEQLERLRLISVEVRSKIQIGEKEIREYYNEHADKFQVDEAFHVRQIFFAIPSGVDQAQKLKVEEKAKKVLSEAKGGADFAELAKKHSDDLSGRDGGDLGFLKRGDLIREIGSALSGLKPGEVSGLIRTSAGIHIMKLEEYRKGQQRDFDSVKREIEDLLYRQKSEERFSQWLDGLRKNAAIEILDKK
ncbi:MAG TPA: peptidylprolyl isomerase [Geobacteraceae bacterium]|nr:peptidylprolyl isomerase [Geobacteraceae bacterium]